MLVRYSAEKAKGVCRRERVGSECNACYEKTGWDVDKSIGSGIGSEASAGGAGDKGEKEIFAIVIDIFDVSLDEWKESEAKKCLTD